MFKEVEESKKKLYNAKEKMINMELQFQEEFKNIVEIAKTNHHERDDVKLDIIQKIAIRNIQIIQEDLYNNEI